MPAGQEGAIAAPAEAAQSTKHTSDLLRRFKEYATSVKEGMKAEPAALTDEETALRNEKIRVDDFQEKLIHASRKVGRLAQPCACCRGAYRQEGKRSIAVELRQARVDPLSALWASNPLTFFAL